MESHSAKKTKCNLAICNDMDGARDYYAKRSKSVRERQRPYNFTHMWNLRNKTKKHRGKKERGKPRNRLNYRKQTDVYQRGGG